MGYFKGQLCVCARWWWVNDMSFPNVDRRTDGECRLAAAVSRVDRSFESAPLTTQRKLPIPYTYGRKKNRRSAIELHGVN